MDALKVGKQIALLRKERKMTGERFAEELGVSPQAVSKWENGICLPNTAILPELSSLLNCSVDDLLMPKELVILEAIYTDGEDSIDVTSNISRYVCESGLNLCVNEELIGAAIESDRLKLLTVKYQIQGENLFCYALQNDILRISCVTDGINAADARFLLLDAYYGNSDGYNSARQKMKHYEYFKWDRITVNHENFPSNTGTDKIEFLTLVYLNTEGIHVISCAEGDTIYYDKNHTSLYLQDKNKCILSNIERLAWGEGRECTWAGAMHAALNFMGNSYTYEQIMGMSGACYRICFVDVWDWSCTDALVSFDYSTRLFNAVGYTAVWADRLDKEARKAERAAIMRDLQNGKPVLAINLRVVPEWGVITGYIDGGSSFLCRTYYDKEIFDGWEASTDKKDMEDRRLTFEERGGYLVNDFWPYLIVHFGERKEKMTEKEILLASLKTMMEAYAAENCGNYSQGRLGYETWIKGLLVNSLFDISIDGENVRRRLAVNENMMLNLWDARRCAEKFLRDCTVLLEGENQRRIIQIADNFKTMSEQSGTFYERIKHFCDRGEFLNVEEAAAAASAKLRREQAKMLQNFMKLEQENIDLAGVIINNLEP